MGALVLNIVSHMKNQIHMHILPHVNTIAHANYFVNHIAHKLRSNVFATLELIVEKIENQSICHHETF